MYQGNKNSQNRLDGGFEKDHRNYCRRGDQIKKKNQNHFS